MRLWRRPSLTCTSRCRNTSGARERHVGQLCARARRARAKAGSDTSTHFDTAALAFAACKPKAPRNRTHPAPPGRRPAARAAWRLSLVVIKASLLSLGDVDQKRRTVLSMARSAGGSLARKLGHRAGPGPEQTYNALLRTHVDAARSKQLVQDARDELTLCAGAKSGTNCTVSQPAYSSMVQPDSPSASLNTSRQPCLAGRSPRTRSAMACSIVTEEAPVEVAPRLPAIQSNLNLALAVDQPAGTKFLPTSERRPPPHRTVHLLMRSTAGVDPRGRAKNGWARGFRMTVGTM